MYGYHSRIQLVFLWVVDRSYCRMHMSPSAPGSHVHCRVAWPHRGCFCSGCLLAWTFETIIHKSRVNECFLFDLPMTGSSCGHRIMSVDVDLWRQEGGIESVCNFFQNFGNLMILFLKKKKIPALKWACDLSNTDIQTYHWSVASSQHVFLAFQNENFTAKIKGRGTKFSNSPTHTHTPRCHTTVITEY